MPCVLMEAARLLASPAPRRSARRARLFRRSPGPAVRPRRDPHRHHADPGRPGHRRAGRDVRDAAQLGRDMYLATSGLPFIRQLDVICPGDARNPDASARFEAAQARPLRLGPHDPPTTRRALLELRARGTAHRRSRRTTASTTSPPSSRPPTSPSTWCWATTARAWPRASPTSTAPPPPSASTATTCCSWAIRCTTARSPSARALRFVGVAGTFSRERFALRFPGLPVVDRLAEHRRAGRLTPDRHDAVKVALLAAGLGSRLGALTAELPKALIAVGGTPLLVHALRFAARLAPDRGGGGRRLRLSRWSPPSWPAARRASRPSAACRSPLVENRDFRQGNLLSLQARPARTCDDDFLLLNVDHIFRPSIAPLVAAARRPSVTAFIDTDRHAGRRRHEGRARPARPGRRPSPRP